MFNKIQNILMIFFKKANILEMQGKFFSSIRNIYKKVGSKCHDGGRLNAFALRWDARQRCPLSPPVPDRALEVWANTVQVGARKIKFYKLERKKDQYPSIPMYIRHDCSCRKFQRIYKKSNNLQQTFKNGVQQSWKIQIQYKISLAFFYTNKECAEMKVGSMILFKSTPEEMKYLE